MAHTPVPSTSFPIAVVKNRALLGGFSSEELPLLRLPLGLSPSSLRGPKPTCRWDHRVQRTALTVAVRHTGSLTFA